MYKGFADPLEIRWTATRLTKSAVPVGKYNVGADSIEFGPGESAHRFVNLEGHSYAAHRGSLKPGGHCVYITGFTPFRKTVKIQ